MNSKVFITQEVASLNYLPAQSFGELVPLTRDDVSSVKGSLINTRIAQDVAHKLQDFNPNIDFIVSSGSPMVAAIVFMELGRRFKQVTVLRWSNRDQCYTPVTIGQ